jgi:hypothetical protein
MRTALLAFASAALLAATACSTHYTPRAPGRISVVMDPGMGLYKDGKTYRTGMFGGNVDEAVAGNPRAEEEVATYQSNQAVGALCTFAGLAAVLASAVVLGSSPPTSNQANNLAPAAGLLVGGLVVDIVGAGFTTAAQTHLWDAINIYNDGVDSRTPGPIAPPRP